MEFFYVVKATQKSGKEDAVIWFTAKSEARANLQLDVELEDAGIETGRGKDYAKPVRTDFPVFDDLPEESTVDYTWCKRYELQDNGRTWLPKAGAESTGAGDNTPAPETTVNVETTIESVPLENRTPAVRFAVHLTSDKYQSHITKEQQLAASEMSLDEGNTYLQNLLLAKNDIPEVAELSLNAEWKLVQAIKQVFAPDEAHETEIIAAFMADWARADAGDRNQLVAEWRSGKINLLKSEITSDAGVTTGQDPEPEGLFGPPKTEAGYRTIKLLEPALEALRAQKELTGSAPKVPITFHHREFGKTETQKLHFVFMPRPQKGKQAAYYSVSSIVSLWDITVRRSGIRRRRPYQLRHTYACWMLSAGANPAFIANQMGHENAEMVFHVYSAWINALDSDQVSFLNQRFGGYANAPIVPLKVKTK